MALVRLGNAFISSAGANDDEFLKIAEINGAVKDLRLGLIRIAFNPDFVCFGLASPKRVYF